jgi:hypothetical protein
MGLVATHFSRSTDAEAESTMSRAPKRIVLTEGLDYIAPDGDAIELTTIGIERMLQAYAAGQDAVIEIDEIVALIYRSPPG